MEQPKQQLTRAEALGKIFNLESDLLKSEDCLYLDDMDYKHWFAPNLYGREIAIPAGIVLTTMVHATEHIAILAKGKMTIFADDGLTVIQAPHTMITKIGTKRAIYTHDDCVFITIHHNPTNETDIPKLIKLMTLENKMESLEVMP